MNKTNKQLRVQGRKANEMAKPPPQRRAQLAPGKLIDGGRYRLLEMIGKGGNGVVWLASHERMNANVAIKFPACSNDERGLHSFETEVQSHVAFSNRHPNIVSILDVGRFDGRPFVVMQYLQNGCLHSRLSGRLSQAHDLYSSPRWLTGIGDALDFIHERGLLHRDVKPGNILLDDSMSAYLADFGIAHATKSSMELKREGKRLLVGSLPYMAAELLRKGDYGPKSDQYAFAVTIYEFLTLRRPFDAEDAKSLAGQQDRESIPPPSQLLYGLPGKVDEVVLRALDHDPESRFASCRELVAEIESEWSVVSALLGNRAATSKARAKTKSPIPSSETAPNTKQGTDAEPTKPKIKLSRVMRRKP